MPQDDEELGMPRSDRMRVFQMRAQERRMALLAHVAEKAIETGGEAFKALAHAAAASPPLAGILALVTLTMLRKANAIDEGTQLAGDALVFGYFGVEEGAKIISELGKLVQLPFTSRPESKFETPSTLVIIEGQPPGATETINGVLARARKDVKP